LEILELRETKIGDAALHHLARMTQLRTLYLYETQVGDAGMASLARLRNLDELSLGHTAVGDAGLVHLAGLTKLKVLKLGLVSRMQDSYTSPGSRNWNSLTSLKPMSQTRAWRTYRA
jgi:hypothetical protein